MSALQNFLVNWEGEIIGGTAVVLAISFRKKIAQFFRWYFFNSIEEELANENNEIIRVEEETKLMNDEISEKLDEMKELLDLLVPLRNGTRTLLFRSLTDRCKEAISAGEIEIDDYAYIEEDYKTYKSLGGNGHMDAWMEQVEKLPKK